MKRIHLEVPVLPKEYTAHDASLWGAFHILVTDKQEGVTALSAAVGTTDIVNLDDYVPVCANLPIDSKVRILITHQDVKRRPAWLGRGITMNRSEKKPWVAYIMMSAEERKAVQCLSEPRSVVEALWRLREYPTKLLFLSDSETVFLGGVFSVNRYKQGSSDSLQRQIYGQYHNR